jgi:hypothetical protein
MNYFRDSETTSITSLPYCITAGVSHYFLLSVITSFHSALHINEGYNLRISGKDQTIIQARDWLPKATVSFRTFVYGPPENGVLSYDGFLDFSSNFCGSKSDSRHDMENDGDLLF